MKRGHHPEAHSLLCEERCGQGGVLRLRFREGHRVVGWARVMGSTIGFLDVPKPLQRRGYGTRILRALVARGYTNGLVVSKAGRRLAARAGFDVLPDRRARFSEKGKARHGMVQADYAEDDLRKEPADACHESLGNAAQATRKNRDR
jgi:hypothetical protein